MNLKLGILKAFADEYQNYVRACEQLDINYEVIDILYPGWVDQIKNSSCDGFLCHPPNDIMETKAIYDEKLYLINKVLQKPIYPSYESLMIYENKRNLINWLQAKEFPHPESWIFARRKDAKNFFKTADFPMVFKTSIGSAATGVDIIKSRNRAGWIADQVFGRVHPAMAMGRLKFGGRLKLPMPLFGRMQKHYLIVQKFYELKWEWRVFFIENYASGYKKLLKGYYASGSKQKEWEAPPDHVFDFARDIYKSEPWFDSMAIDIFETSEGELLVNELQALFGNPGRKYRMKYMGEEGHFKYNDGERSFEPGAVDQDDLSKFRVEHFIKILQEKH
ncbi:MAG: hypothetical protein K9G58_08830 [Bacteroidales bacterium]|nr:hypothetical protein [Bacteroidales bacterium]MCF8388445.1 hypothetical protein [Bacteroidales bacterium]MCF8398258.1 hypothetical protein [Bacteroidales bacterium]